MSIPKVFISYSHDTIEHKQWILNLGSRLRANGVDAILDLWELKPGDDLPSFMEKNLASSDYIIMVCTERYVEKANLGTGGVGYEKMIITSTLLTTIDQNKIIPIVKQIDTIALPTFLKSKIHINFSKTDDFEICFDELLRALHKSPLFEKPVIGMNPFSNENLNPKLESLIDPVEELMKMIVLNYEQGNSFEEGSWLSVLQSSLGISRIMFDLLINKAESEGLISKNYELAWLTHKGKLYAVNKGLVQ